MPEANAYLIGTIGLGLIFGLICLARGDLMRIMVYSGLLYLGYGFVMFLAIRLLVSDPAKTITPGYWGPPSLLNLNSKSGGYGIEDAVFSFFAGGIAAGFYDLLFNLKAAKKQAKNLNKGHALFWALIVSSAILVLSPLNAIYFFIFLQFFGAAAIVWQRRDLLVHSIVGGLLFMVLYGLLFTVFTHLFPHFLSDYYHLQRTSHISVTGIPLEELLYGLTLGLMWAPIYEYEHRVKDSKRRSSGLRKLVLAAGAARR